MGKLMVSGKLVKCPECGGRDIMKKGRVPSRTGQKPRYLCVKCARSFYLPTKRDTRKPDDADEKKE